MRWVKAGQEWVNLEDIHAMGQDRTRRGNRKGLGGKRIVEGEWQDFTVREKGREACGGRDLY